MKPILEQIADIKAIKHDIREAIKAQGGRLGGEAPFSDYPDAILALSGPGPDACRVIFIDWDGTILKDVKVNPGDAVRLIPNPANGKKLKEGSLKATYTVKEKVKDDKGKEEEKDVEKVIVITPDGCRNLTLAPKELLIL